MRGAVTADEYTPFGYLRNPSHRAASWSAVEGGNLRSAFDRVGVEWVYPLQRNPRAGAGIRLETGTRRTRADFAAVGLTSRYHSANMLGFDWRADGADVAARFFLVDEDALAARLEAPADYDVTFVRHAQGEPTGLAHVLVLADGNPRWAALARAPTQEAARQHAQAALARAEERYRELLAEDAAFTARCPLLSGDWPANWREGLKYDFETTRLLVQPPRGIFTDLWPAWMVSWPRVVLAEGALDMLRLAYADTDTARRAVLSMFRDAPQPNVPCVFEDGSYNMLAADGSRCGTSPAWCLPFLNLELLYLSTLDRDWLRSLYPYLTAYLEFWLRERVDRQGWVVYKCTWESGEDGNPRLDPTGSGDGVIEARVRPVELQATMAHAARVMRFFASELGLRHELRRWRGVERAYRQRTRRLFDPTERRYRDWLTQEQRFQEPRPDQPYWGVDSCRWSPLGLTPLLIGERLGPDELWRHAQAPWTWWPSWTHALVESAAAAGHFERVGTLAAEIVDRVYRVTTRQELGALERPMPGCAPEFWPEDWRTYQGHDAYGWGATTANLLLRHVIGLKQSRVTGSWVLELTPALSPGLRAQGRRLGVRQLNYRGESFDLEYAVDRDGLLSATLQLRTSEKRCTLKDASGESLYGSKRSAQHHEFELRNGRAYRLELN